MPQLPQSPAQSPCPSSAVPASVTAPGSSGNFHFSLTCQHPERPFTDKLSGWFRGRHLLIHRLAPHLPWCPAPAHGGLRAHGAPRLLATCPPQDQARSFPPGPSRLCPPAWRPAFRCPLKSFHAEEPPRLCHVTLQSCSLAVCAARMPAPSRAAASLLSLGWAPSKGFLFGAPETALLCTVSGQKPRATLSSCLFF